MTTVGVRELKERASDIVRRVREDGEEVAITFRGVVIARLVPASRPRPSPRRVRGAWSEVEQVAREIEGRWPKGVSARRAVRKGRRG
jgi:prevent-host-death family protein